jgi:hypothetical protein
VTCSHYVSKTTSPKWDTNAEIIVDDITKTVLSVFVYNWDGCQHYGEDTFLGSANLHLTPDNPAQVRQTIDLSSSQLGELNFADPNIKLGSVTVTAVFRPISSIADAKSLAMRLPWFETAYQRMRSEVNNKTDKGAKCSLPSVAGSGIVELSIICAKDLVAMDRNGFSDPYCEVLIGGRKKIYDVC